jgi:hypothetical protein
MAQVDSNIRSLKWKLWHGQIDRALDQLETMMSGFAKLRERGNLSATRLLHRRTLADLHPLKQERDYQLRSPLSIRSAHRDGLGRVRCEFPGRPTHGQKAADAMVKARRPSSASGSGRRSQRRSSHAPHVRAAETGQSIEDRVDVRADTAATQDGLTPQLIYRSRRILAPLAVNGPHPEASCRTGAFFRAFAGAVRTSSAASTWSASAIRPSTVTLAETSARLSAPA